MQEIKKRTGLFITSYHLFSLHCEGVLNNTGFLDSLSEIRHPPKSPQSLKFLLIEVSHHLFATPGRNLSQVPSQGACLSHMATIIFQRFSFRCKNLNFLPQLSQFAIVYPTVHDTSSILFH